MSLRTSLVLMVLFLGLGYLAFFEPLRTADRDEEKAQREAHVLWLKDKKLASVVIAGAKSAQPVHLNCAAKDLACPFDSGGEWVIVEPEKANADNAAVATLLMTLLNTTHSQKLDFDAGYDEKEFGLDHPRALVTLRLAGAGAGAGGARVASEAAGVAGEITLKLGQDAAASPSTYLSVSSDPHHLFLVPNYLVGMIDQDFFHWRNKRLFPGLEASAVTRISWPSKKMGEVVAVRAGEEWRLEKPRALAASKIMFEGLSSTLAFAAAKAIFAESRTKPEAKKVVSGSPELTVRFRAGAGGARVASEAAGVGGARVASEAAGAEHVMRLFPKAGKDRYALVDDLAPVYVVDAATFDRFQKDLPEYRRRSSLTESERTAVDVIRLVFPRDKQEITLQRKDGLWAPTGGDKIAGVVSQARIDGFLGGLRDSDFKSFLDVKGASPEAKAWRAQTPDVRAELKIGDHLVATVAILVFQRKQALTEAEGEVRAFGNEEFLKALPVRLADLTQTANQSVVLPEKEAPDGHDHRPERR